ncbi:MAG: exopolyphosphatase [Bacteroidia bacterium]|jgi:exopolyphosphatase/guanosine-5'-triphosphate,3'-diphosphate pyrophosphatase
MKLAAIDIGSNAVRLLIANVIESNPSPVFKKIELVRVPLRLGEDSFIKGYISEEKIKRLVKTMHSFRLLIDVFEAEGFRVCATSAMRDASNREEVIDRVKKETDLFIEVVDGKMEAQIIYSNHTAEELDKDFSYLYIDVGGGSTELTLFAENKIIASQSFNIGTIRLLHEQVSKETWNSLKAWVELKTKSAGPLTAIGSGGNINKIYKLVYGKDTKAMSYKKVKEITDYISEFSYEERITQLGLNEDRADVILPASKIFLTVMKSGGIDKILVPQSGLSDGIIHLLYEQKLKQTTLFQNK